MYKARVVEGYNTIASPHIHLEFPSSPLVVELKFLWFRKKLHA
jgi:hypothetical protein